MKTARMLERIITTSEAIREATDQAMAADEKVIIIGEGVPDPKGIFGTTLGLKEKYGAKRVWDMPVAENAMTGICIGAAIRGFKPILTHQRLDFSLLSMDQIVNNAAKWFYMFGGQVSVPLVIRMVIGHGWGQGAQHSQQLHSLFAHIPGLKVVMPSTPYDAKGLLLSSIEDPNPVIFLEHRWVHGLTGEVPLERYMIPLGRARKLNQGKDVTVVTSGYMSVETMRAAELLAQHGIEADVVDLRCLRPLDAHTILTSVSHTKRLVVVDGAWPTASLATNIIARVATKLHGVLLAPPAAITFPDMPSPSSPGLTKEYYPNYRTITEKIMNMMGHNTSAIKKQWQEEDMLQITPHDVPDPSFTGPF